MKTLIKLRLLQAKGAVRHLFSKPLSAVVTVLVVLLYGSLFAPLVVSADKPPLSGGPARAMVLNILAFALLMISTTLIQKRKSMFFLNDAHYLFTGPISQRKILLLFGFDLLLSAMLFGLVSLVPVVWGVQGGSVSPLFLLLAFFACTAAHYGVLCINGILYVQEMAGEKVKRGSVWVMGVLAASVVLLVGVTLANHGFSMHNSYAALAESPLLNYLPFYGWARMAMLGLLTREYLLLGIGCALLLGVGGFLTLLLVKRKGDFAESSMQDAESFTEYYRRARQGESVGAEKIHQASIRFRAGEGAIYSKNLLIAKKGRELLRMQDFLVIGIYLLLAFFMNMGFVTFCGMLMFWMLMMASTSSLVEDLQHHYVYLIPGGAVKKLVATLLVPLGKQVIVLLVSVLGGGLLLGAGADDIVTAALVCLSILLLFTAGNVLSIRLLKSRSNKMLEQSLRIVLTIVALLPGLLVFILAAVLLGETALILAAPIFTVFNLLLAVVVLLCCAPMMQGNEINAD